MVVGAAIVADAVEVVGVGAGEGEVLEAPHPAVSTVSASAPAAQADFRAAMADIIDGWCPFGLGCQRIGRSCLPRGGAPRPSRKLSTAGPAGTRRDVLVRMISFVERSHQ